MRVGRGLAFVAGALLLAGILALFAMGPTVVHAVSVSKMSTMAKAKAKLNARTGVLDARADAVTSSASALSSSWHTLPRANGKPNGPHYAATVASDGQMHWLRQYWLDRLLNGPPNPPAIPPNARLGKLMVGAAGIAGAAPVHEHYDVNPAVDPWITHARMAVFATFSAVERAFITTHSAALAGMAVAAPTILWPNNVAKYGNCDGTIITGLITLGAAVVGNNLAKADAGFAIAFGPALTCTLNKPVAAVQDYIAIAAAHGAELSALINHYQRFQALLPSPTLDIWELRGWLYATDRLRGHRLVAATGYATDGPRGADYANLEGTLLQTRDGAGARTYGLQHDTVGHVRPQSMGGERDPLNFVPQSRLGQVMVAPGETFALELARHCGVPNVARYTVVFTYGGVGATDRRPTRVRTIVDLLAPCTQPNLGNVALVPANGLFDEDFANY